MGIIEFSLVRFTLRQAFGRHRLGRWVFLGFLTVLPALIVLVVLQAGRFEPELSQGLADREFRVAFLRGLFEGFQLPLLYPLIALLLVVPALREEIDGGTLPYLWLKPLSREAIVFSKYVGALLGALSLAVLSTALGAALLLPEGPLLGRLVLVTLVALPAYGALFFVLSVWTQRALLLGLVYVIAWEELFSRVSDAASRLSVRHYAVAVEQALLGEPSELSLGASLGVLLGLVGVLLALATWRFSQMEFPGGEEA